MLDGSTERRLTLAEVEPSNGFRQLAHRCWSPLPTYRIYAMPEVTAFGKDMPSGFAPVSVTPSKARLTDYYY